MGAPTGLRRAPPALLAAVLACAVASGCATLDAWPSGCGNSVVDPGEDCDGEFSTAGHCGAPGAKSACRWDCSSGEACPAGFGCGADGICRAPSGELEPGPSIDGAITSLLAVDADGDGRTDLVRSSTDQLAISFFAGRAAAGHVAVRAPDAPAVVADLTGDGLAEVVTRSPFGVSVYRVTPQRALTSQLYSTTTLSNGARAVALDALPPSFFDELVYLTDAGVAVGPAPDAPLLASGSYGSDMVEAATGEVLEDAAVRCDELVLGALDSHELVVLTPCRAIGASVDWNVGGPGHVALPSVQTIDAMGSYSAGERFTPLVALADVNGDGHLDAVVATMVGAEVAYGVGDGTFHSTPDVPVSDGDGKTSKLTLTVDGSEYPVDAPLAVGDVNGDGFADFVDWISGVLVSDLVGTELRYASAPPGGLARARLTDLDGDGRVDILGTHVTYSGPVQPGYSGDFGSEKPVLFRGAGDGVFTEVAMPVDGRLSAMAVGDFDGDGATDVALALLPDDGGSTDAPADGAVPTTDLAIAWGRVGSAPAAAQVIGGFSDVVQLVSGRLVGGDAPADLVVVAGFDTVTEAILAGASDRQLRSPYELHDPGTGSLESPTFGPVAGRLSGGASPSLLLMTQGALELGATPGVWQLALDQDAQVDAQRSQAPQNLYGGDGVAVDLDGDGVDELVVTSFGTLQVLRRQGSEVAVVHETSWADGDAVTTTPAAADLDADGHPDVILAMASGRLAILWNDGDVALDSARATYVGEGASVPAPPDGTGGAGFGQASDGAGAVGVTAVFRFGAAQLDADPELEIVASTIERVLVLDLDVATRTYHPTDTPVDAPVSALAFASGDFDGDGVVDVAVGDAERTTILWGVPVQP